MWGGKEELRGISEERLGKRHGKEEEDILYKEE